MTRGPWWEVLMSLGGGHRRDHWDPRLFLSLHLVHGPEVRGFVRPCPAVVCCLDVMDRWYCDRVPERELLMKKKGLCLTAAEAESWRSRGRP